MERKSQHNNILLATIGFAAVVVIVGVIGFLTFGRTPDVIQGEVEVSEYRVSSKVPGRILELRVKEGDYVKVGDTLAVIDAPDVEAKKMQAMSAEDAASALSDMAERGARREEVRGAFELWQQAKAGLEIAEKSYGRVQRLFDEGVMSGQKRDEAYANYKAMEAQAKAAKSRYDMAVAGARREEREAAAAQKRRAQGAVREVDSYVRETVQVAQAEGEVSDVYPKVGELVGAGSPIMSISVMSDQWGTFNYCPAFDKDLRMKVYYIKDEGSYAVWKATKSNGQYDLKTFEVKARPIDKLDGLRPGMSLIIGRQ